MIERRAYEFCWTDGIFRDCIRTGYFFAGCCKFRMALFSCSILSAAAGGRYILNLCVREELQGRGLARQVFRIIYWTWHSVQTQTVFLEGFAPPTTAPCGFTALREFWLNWSANRLLPGGQG